MSKAQPDHNFDVTEDSGYEFEDKVKARIFNGWGGKQTRLPRGHLARRDTPTSLKHAKPGANDEDAAMDRGVEDDGDG